MGQNTIYEHDPENFEDAKNELSSQNEFVLYNIAPDFAWFTICQLFLSHFLFSNALCLTGPGRVLGTRCQNLVGI